MKRICLTFFLVLGMSLTLLAAASGGASVSEKLPVKGMVTLVDLGVASMPALPLDGAHP